MTEQYRALKAASEGLEYPALLEKVQRYEAALLRIVEQAREQEALIEHRETTGQDVTSGDKQVWQAYRETAKLAASALRLGPDALL